MRPQRYKCASRDVGTSCAKLGIAPQEGISQSSVLHQAVEFLPLTSCLERILGQWVLVFMDIVFSEKVRNHSGAYIYHYKNYSDITYVGKT